MARGDAGAAGISRFGGDDVGGVVAVSGEKRSNGVPEVYSLLLGGLMASFVAVIVFTWMVDTSGLGATLVCLPC